nr:cytochrome b/b6 domain-containing protein [Phyllobacterium sp. YR531]
MKAGNQLTKSKGFSPSFRVLHWIIAMLVFAVWPLGMLLKYFKDDVKLDFYLLHESFGFLVLWLMLLRLGMRLSQGRPAHHDDWTGIISRIVHWLLYVALIVMPVSGFLATNAHGFPLRWFGVVPVWSPIGREPTIAPIFSIVHSGTAWLILTLVGLHIAGALFHRIIRRDDVFQRML